MAVIQIRTKEVYRLRDLNREKHGEVTVTYDRELHRNSLIAKRVAMVEAKWLELGEKPTKARRAKVLARIEAEVEVVINKIEEKRNA